MKPIKRKQNVSSRRASHWESTISFLDLTQTSDDETSSSQEQCSENEYELNGKNVLMEESSVLPTQTSDDESSTSQEQCSENKYEMYGKNFIMKKNSVSPKHNNGSLKESSVVSAGTLWDVKKETKLINKRYPDLKLADEQNSNKLKSSAIDSVKGLVASCSSHSMNMEPVVYETNNKKLTSDEDSCDSSEISSSEEEDDVSCHVSEHSTPKNVNSRKIKSVIETCGDLSKVNGNTSYESSFKHLVPARKKRPRKHNKKLKREKKKLRTLLSEVANKTEVSKKEYRWKSQKNVDTRYEIQPVKNIKTILSDDIESVNNESKIEQVVSTRHSSVSLVKENYQSKRPLSAVDKNSNDYKKDIKKQKISASSLDKNVDLMTKICSSPIDSDCDDHASSADTSKDLALKNISIEENSSNNLIKYDSLDDPRIAKESEFTNLNIKETKETLQSLSDMMKSESVTHYTYNRDNSRKSVDNPVPLREPKVPVVVSFPRPKSYPQPSRETESEFFFLTSIMKVRDPIFYNRINKYVECNDCQNSTSEESGMHSGNSSSVDSDSGDDINKDISSNIQVLKEKSETTCIDFKSTRASPSVNDIAHPNKPVNDSNISDKDDFNSFNFENRALGVAELPITNGLHENIVVVTEEPNIGEDESDPVDPVQCPEAEPKPHRGVTKPNKEVRPRVYGAIGSILQLLKDKQKSGSQDPELSDKEKNDTQLSGADLIQCNAKKDLSNTSDNVDRYHSIDDKFCNDKKIVSLDRSIDCKTMKNKVENKAYKKNKVAMSPSTNDTDCEVNSIKTNECFPNNLVCETDSFAKNLTTTSPSVNGYESTEKNNFSEISPNASLICDVGIKSDETTNTFTNDKVERKSDETTNTLTNDDSLASKWSNPDNYSKLNYSKFNMPYKNFGSLPKSSKKRKKIDERFVKSKTQMTNTMKINYFDMNNFANVSDEQYAPSRPSCSPSFESDKQSESGLNQTNDLEVLSPDNSISAGCILDTAGQNGEHSLHMGNVEDNLAKKSSKPNRNSTADQNDGTSLQSFDMANIKDKLTKKASKPVRNSTAFLLSKLRSHDTKNTVNKKPKYRKGRNKTLSIEADLVTGSTATDGTLSNDADHVTIGSAVTDVSKINESSAVVIHSDRNTAKKDNTMFHLDNEEGVFFMKKIKKEMKENSMKKTRFHLDNEDDEKGTLSSLDPSMFPLIISLPKKSDILICTLHDPLSKKSKEFDEDSSETIQCVTVLVRVQDIINEDELHMEILGES